MIRLMRPSSENLASDPIVEERVLLKQTFFVIVFFILMSILTLYVARQMNYDLTDAILGILGTEVAIIAIYYSHRLAIGQKTVMGRHSEQLKLLRGISSSINLAQRLSENIDKSMANTRRETIQYSCIFLSIYNKRPLPLVAAGDLYALYVLQMLLGQNQIELIDVNDFMLVNKKRDLASFVNKNCIFLCSPLANPALRRIAPIIPMSNNVPAKAMNVSLAGVNLPVWFGSEEINGRNVGCLYYPENLNYETSDTVPNEMRQARPVSKSPSEPSYDVAASAGDNEKPELNETCQFDLGIIMRVTPPSFSVDDDMNILIAKDKKPNRKLFIIAGIHQFGTWMAAEFFRRVLFGETKGFGHLMFQENDFSVVISGEFSTKDLRVVDVNAECAWQHRESMWHRLTSAEAYEDSENPLQTRGKVADDSDQAAAFRVHNIQSN